MNLMLTKLRAVVAVEVEEAVVVTTEAVVVVREAVVVMAVVVGTRGCFRRQKRRENENRKKV